MIRRPPCGSFAPWQLRPAFSWRQSRLSRRHASIRHNPASGEFVLTDLDSSNGTYMAIRDEVPLASGDFVRIGQHLFRVDFGTRELPAGAPADGG